MNKNYFTLTFCDYNQAFSSEIKQYFPKSKIIIEDITKIQVNDNTTFMSSANSFLYFDGGVDQAYTDMFGKKLQNYGQEYLRQNITYKIASGGKYLPVGSSIIIPVNYLKSNNNKNRKNIYVIACPTMFRPQSIKDTRNVYWAVYAGISNILKFNRDNSDKTQHIHNIVFPAFGTCYGKLSYAESSKQIYEGFVDAICQKYDNDETPENFLQYIDNKEPKETDIYDNKNVKTIIL